MTIERLAYWAAFSVPLILLGITGFIRMLVEGGREFKREHWYLGIDLTIYFLSSTLINVLDIAKAFEVNTSKMTQAEIAAMTVHNETSLIWTAVMLAGAVAMLFAQTSLHRVFTERPKNRFQFFFMVIFCNSLGVLVLFEFVKLKAKGTI